MGAPHERLLLVWDDLYPVHCNLRNEILGAKRGVSVHCRAVPRNLKRYYGAGDLHYVTFSCYQRLPLLGSGQRRDLVLRALEAARRNYQLLVVGYVVMPEHVHLLVSEPQRANLSTALKALKQGVSRRVLRRLRRGCRQPGLFGDGGELKRFWQARFYDFNVWTAKKRVEKLRYMHRNPVKRGLVASPGVVALEQFPPLRLRREGHGGGECNPAADVGTPLGRIAEGLHSHTSKGRSCGAPTCRILDRPVRADHVGHPPRGPF